MAKQACNYYLIEFAGQWRIMLHLPEVLDGDIGIRSFDNELEGLRMINFCNRSYAESKE